MNLYVHKSTHTVHHTYLPYTGSSKNKWHSAPHYQLQVAYKGKENQIHPNAGCPNFCKGIKDITSPCSMELYHSLDSELNEILRYSNILSWAVGSEMSLTNVRWSSGSIRQSCSMLGFTDWIRQDPPLETSSSLVDNDGVFWPSDCSVLSRFSLFWWWVKNFSAVAGVENRCRSDLRTLTRQAPPNNTQLTSKR